jgi:hypothetical protein
MLPPGAPTSLSAAAYLYQGRKAMTLLDKQMDRFTKQSLTELVTGVKGPCVSIYMPTERKGAETQQGPIRLKNLLNQAEEQLVGMGERTTDIRDLLAAAYTLANDGHVWQYQSDGLALFLAPDRMITYRLPLQFPETVLANERFYVKPLLPMLSGDGIFYLLTLTQGSVHLLQGSRYSMAEVELGDEIPKSLAEALKYDDVEKHLQFRTAAMPSTGGRGSAMYHGHGNAGDEALTKENILRFFRQLDNGVRDILEGSDHPPLVLAGIDYLRGLYQQVNQYNEIIDQGVENDPEALSLEELHARAWGIVEPIFLEERQVALDGYYHLAGTNDKRAAHTIEQIVEAAYYQRVDTLFMPDSMGVDEAIWGSFNPEKNTLSLHEERKQGDEDLLDFAAVHTLLNGGDVYLMDENELPDDVELAAILRY